MARKSNRPLVLALLIAVAVVAAGYGLSLIRNATLSPSATISRQLRTAKKEGAAKPWYKNQPPPLELVRAEAQPVFPETSRVCGQLA